MPTPILLAGPTASGKSAVALCLAEQLGGEIVSADSMQVYRGLDVGTAKPGAADLLRVRHHLIDLVGPDECFDAARWLEAAKRACEAISQRGRQPLIVGGTGLYFRAWCHGLDAPAPGDAGLRAELESQPLEILLQELAAGDPATFARIDRQNPRRIVRAVEILRTTGNPMPPRSSAALVATRTRAVLLRRDSGDLRQRIEARVESIFNRGLVEETRRLLGHGLATNHTAMQALGYRQVAEHLRGERDLRATIVLVKTKTWQYARRQMTWFRHQLNAAVLEVGADEDPAATAGRIAALVREPTSAVR